MKILVVEDEPKLSRGLVTGLQNRRYAVDSAFDGEEGERMARMNEYDLVILDVMMPKRDGFEVCRNLRQAGIHTPILFLTAKDALEDKVGGLDIGGDDYMVKPFSFSELEARVRTLLRRAPIAVPDVLELDALKLDTRQQRLIVHSQEIGLTLREFALLEYLLRNKGTVITREDILDHVWDRFFDSFSNVVDVHLKNLRKKLPTEYAKRIETIWVKGTGLLSGRFHRARLRLTIIYVLILTVILFLSSSIIYSSFSARLAHRFGGDHHPRPIFILPDGTLPPTPEQVEADLIETLLIVNGLLLVAAGMLSYWLAGITLQPIQATYERQRRFLGDASHELRTPLAILQTDLENELDDHKIKDMSRARAESQLEEVQRMSGLVSDLLALSRIDEDGEQRRVLQPINVLPVIEETITRLQPIAERQAIQLTYTPPEMSELVILADQELLLQIFSNIVKNAIVYNKEGGSVAVVPKVEDSYVKITIADTGIGISKQDIGRITERFYRSDTSRSRQTGGSGLGLSIVQTALDRVHGSMNIESIQDAGTVVVLVFAMYHAT